LKKFNAVVSYAMIVTPLLFSSASRMVAGGSESVISPVTMSGCRSLKKFWALELDSAISAPRSAAVAVPGPPPAKSPGPDTGLGCQPRERDPLIQATAQQDYTVFG
jgi:hypothetical protein